METSVEETQAELKSLEERTFTGEFPKQLTKHSFKLQQLGMRLDELAELSRLHRQHGSIVRGLS